MQTIRTFIKCVYADLEELNSRMSLILSCINVTIKEQKENLKELLIEFQYPYNSPGNFFQISLKTAKRETCKVLRNFQNKMPF